MVDVKRPTSKKKTVNKATVSSAKSKVVAAKQNTKKAEKPAAAKSRKASVKVASSKAISEQKSLTPGERYQWVATRAYYIAESDGFKGDPVTYWTKAELQIAAILK